MDKQTNSMIAKLRAERHEFWTRIETLKRGAEIYKDSDCLALCNQEHGEEHSPGSDRINQNQTSLRISVRLNFDCLGSLTSYPLLWLPKEKLHRFIGIYNMSMASESLSSVAFGSSPVKAQKMVSSISVDILEKCWASIPESQVQGGWKGLI
jgi:hypothetical protein